MMSFILSKSAQLQILFVAMHQWLSVSSFARLCVGKRLGTDVEGTEAALARAVRSGDNSKFRTTFHLSRNEIRVTAFAWGGGAAKNTVGPAAAVERYTILATIGIGQISISVVVEERYGNAMTPRVGIDALYFAARRTVGLAGRLTVRQLDNVNVLICTHNRLLAEFGHKDKHFLSFPTHSPQKNCSKRKKRRRAGCEGSRTTRISTSLNGVSPPGIQSLFVVVIPYSPLNNSSNCSLNHSGGLSTTLCVWLLLMCRATMWP